MDFGKDIERYSWLLKQLLNAQVYEFNSELRAALPEEQGIYRISNKDSDHETTLRVGRTKTSSGGLKQRVYQNHFMGNQSGNLRQQLVRAGYCRSIEEAKQHIKENYQFQFLVVKDDEERKWLEHFALSILKPKFSD